MLMNKLKNKHFSIQSDEATDSNKDAHLICYVLFTDRIHVIKELLFCEPIF